MFSIFAALYKVLLRMSAKRISQKRPTTVSKETYYSVKRDLLQCQKRPATVGADSPPVVHFSILFYLLCQWGRIIFFYIYSASGGAYGGDVLSK